MYQTIPRVRVACATYGSVRASLPRVHRRQVPDGFIWEKDVARVLGRGSLLSYGCVSTSQICLWREFTWVYATSMFPQRGGREGSR